MSAKKYNLVKSESLCERKNGSPGKYRCLSEGEILITDPSKLVRESQLRRHSTNAMKFDANYPLDLDDLPETCVDPVEDNECENINFPQYGKGTDCSTDSSSSPQTTKQTHEALGDADALKAIEILEESFSGIDVVQEESQNKDLALQNHNNKKEMPETMIPSEHYNKQINEVISNECNNTILKNKHTEIIDTKLYKQTEVPPYLNGHSDFESENEKEDFVSATNEHVVNKVKDILKPNEQTLNKLENINGHKECNNHETEIKNENGKVNNSRHRNKDGIERRNSRLESVEEENIPSTPQSTSPKKISFVNADVHCMSNGSLDGALISTTPSGSVDLNACAFQPSHFVVVAIDFGTKFSGYAFSFVRDPNSTYMMRKSDGGDPGVINQKTLTILLLTPEGAFHTFGFSARNCFHNLDPDEAKDWLYFENFKMTLHHDLNLNKDTEIKAINGKSLPAITVFAHSLRYFKKRALQELSDHTGTKILNEDVQWVITIPAIWKQPAKQFMRQAAYTAGIASPDYPEQLLIALEPEAASIYCRKLRMHQLVPETPPVAQFLKDDKPLNTEMIVDKMDRDSIPMTTFRESVEKQFTQGTRYMVVDCGGGTVDITVHEMENKKGNLKELHKATGGPYGSVGVDLEFEKLLNEVFGADFIEQFKLKRPAGYVDLMMAFEAGKRNVNPYRFNSLNIFLSSSFTYYFKKFKGQQVGTAIRRYGDKDVKWSKEMLQLTTEAVQRLFTPTIEKIKQHIEDVLNSPDVNDIKYLFLVGGFAESRILQQEIRNALGSILKVIIPQESSLTILKGAVLFGLDPTIINVRRSRMTYGVGVLNRFIHNKHPVDKLVIKDGIEWCVDVFDKFVEVDQSVGLEDTVLRSYTPVKLGQISSVINIYCTDQKNVNYTTDAGVQKCGTLHLDLSDSQYQHLPRRREIQMRMIFGDTEVKLSALDIMTGKCVRSAIDFFKT